MTGSSCAKAMKVTMTVTAKVMATQRWICRTHLFQFNGTSSEDEQTQAPATCAGSFTVPTVQVMAAIAGRLSAAPWMRIRFARGIADGAVANPVRLLGRLLARGDETKNEQDSLHAQRPY